MTTSVSKARRCRFYVFSFLLLVLVVVLSFMDLAAASGRLVSEIRGLIGTESAQIRAKSDHERIQVPLEDSGGNIQSRNAAVGRFGGVHISPRFAEHDLLHQKSREAHPGFVQNFVIYHDTAELVFFWFISHFQRGPAAMERLLKLGGLQS